MADTNTQQQSQQNSDGGAANNQQQQQQQQQPNQQQSQTQQQSTTQQQQTMQQQQQSGVPDKYELKLAEGSPLTSADVEEIAAYAKVQGFSQQQAAAFLERTEKRHIARLEQQQTFLESEKTKWVNAVKADKDLGGDNYNVTLQHRKTVLDRFAPDGSEFRKLLNETGFIEHPELNRFLSKIGKAMAEDTTRLREGGGDGKQGEPKTLAAALYGRDS